MDQEDNVPVCSDSGASVIKLGPNQTINACQESHQALLGAVRGGRDLVVDCSAVTDADLSLVQLLIAARRSARACGVSVRVASPTNPALVRVLTSAGIIAPDRSGADGFWSGEQ